MLLYAHRKSLLRAVQDASKTAPRNGKPILQNLILSAKGSNGHSLLTIGATDLERSVTLRAYGAKVDNEGTALVPAGRLCAALKELTGDDVLIETTAEHCYIASERGGVTLPTDNPEDYPAFPEVSPELPYAEVECSALAKLINQVAPFCAKESARYSMTGALVEFDRGIVRLVGTDGRRLSVAECSADVPEELTAPAMFRDTAGCESEWKRIVPLKALWQLETACLVAAKQEPHATVKIVFSHPEPGQSEAYFSLPGAELFTQLVPGRYPNYREVFPRKETSTITFNAAELCTATKSVATAIDDECKRIKYCIDGANCRMESKSASGKAEAIVSVGNYSNAVKTIAFDGDYILDYLRSLATPAQLKKVSVEMRIVDGTSPAEFRADDGMAYRHIIMPLA